MTTKAERYVEALNGPGPIAPCFRLVFVDGDGDCAFNEDSHIASEYIPEFIEWLRDTFIDEITTDDRFGDADTKKVDHDDD